MNIVFYLIIILLAVLIWLGCSFLYKDIGGFFTSLWGSAVEEMTDEDD